MVVGGNVLLKNLLRLKKCETSGGWPGGSAEVELETSGRQPGGRAEVDQETSGGWLGGRGGVGDLRQTTRWMEPLWRTSRRMTR